MDCIESHASKHVTVTPVCGRTRHATGCTLQKGEYDQLAARLLGKLGRFQVLARHNWCSDLAGVIDSAPVIVEVKSPAEKATWPVYDDVKNITQTGRCFMPQGFAAWRKTLFDHATKTAPYGKLGLVRTYAVAATSQLFRYVLDYPDKAAEYAEWTGLSLPQVKHPRDIVALLVVPKENAASADLSMRLICELKYATAEVLTEDARLRVYRIRCTAFSA